MKIHTEFDKYTAANVLQEEAIKVYTSFSCV